MAVNILTEARAILGKEMESLERTMLALDEGFVQAVRLIQKSPGKLVVTGIGKSGLIGQKIAATMASTGTLAVFMHAADALHGDLGMVHSDDVVLAMSHSGQTAELLDIVVPIRRIGAKIIAMVGNPDSDLAHAADCIIRLDVPQEADHLNLAPTASALASLAVGDALAGVLSKQRNFRHEDFALYHPGGSLGRRLLLTVRDLMHGGDRNPMILPGATVDEVLAELTEKRLGGVNVIADRRSRKLVGIVTDGDLKRALKQRERFFDLKASDLMTKNPTVVCEEDKAAHALQLMEDRPFQISVLPVVNKQGRAVGMLRMHDLLKIC